MANYASILQYYFFSILVVSMSISRASADIDRKLHIVYMGLLPKGDYSPSSHHLSLLQRVIEKRSIENLLVRSYGRSFNGFTAMLSDIEAQMLASLKEVVSVFPSRSYKLQTTRSWSFMGFNESAHRKPEVESNVIVGVLDTGIWPESESFNDKGFGPPPSKWLGSCKGGQNFACNKKVIGARYYGNTEASGSARDDVGHGTHTASTAAGNVIKDASFFGIAQGTARGGVPSARIAAYKVCQSTGCHGEDILAGFDDAIADGVDIITISVGSDSPAPFDEDPVAIGAFHAIHKGILVSQSAGNDGPDLGSVTSAAPWLFTVAASSIDRRIIDKVVLGNGRTLIGNSINSFELKGSNISLLYGSNSESCTPELARYCRNGCLNDSLVHGKIVLCSTDNGNIEAERAGAAGSILLTNRFEDVSFVSPSSLLYLNHENFATVESYVNSTSKPLATILKSEAIKDSSAPVVASFSARGPNVILLNLLKPDISAPGIDILAAFPTDIPPSDHGDTDGRRVKFNIISGTSMSCPHAAAIAAYIKSFHPEWSPFAIKSALMTTAFPMNSTTSSDNEFAYGSGHINPTNAIDPGLVYEANYLDYTKFLCSIRGYTEDKVRLILGDNSTFPIDASINYLNYPSMTATVTHNKPFTVNFYRTVTNVGLANSTYEANIFTTSKLKIQVVPETLSFNAINEKKSFNVSVAGESLDMRVIVSASLVWSDGSHFVRSPIVVHTFYFSNNDFAHLGI